MQNLKQLSNKEIKKEKNNEFYFDKLNTRPPTNYPFFLRDNKRSYPDTYKEDYNYCIILVDPETQKPVDSRIVKTQSTLEKFIKDKHNRHKLDILFHPNPVKLGVDFWKEYRQAKSGAERLNIFAKHGVLTDANMLFIDTITIDIDSPAEEALKVLNELTLELDIPAEIMEVRKTKSGNLRIAIQIEPVKPDTLNRNGNSNLKNIKEFVSIINNYFKKFGLKADDSFKRINHPVWITKNEKVIFEATEAINFYTLYRKAKELNKKLKAEQREKQQKKEKKPKRRLVYLPAFVANNFRHIEHKTTLEKAVETLARRNRKGRYIHFLQVVAGWCKYLGLSYWEYYNLVCFYVKDKKDSQKDIKKAWKYARPLEFKNENKEYKYDLVEYADKVISYLKKNGATERQVLLKEVFDNQKWLEQLVMQELKEQGLIKEWFEKQERGKGRPKKVYQIIENKEPENDNSKSIENNGFTQKNLSKQEIISFSQINTSSLMSILEVVGVTFKDFYSFFFLSGNFACDKILREMEKREKSLIDTS